MFYSVVIIYMIDPPTTVLIELTVNMRELGRLILYTIVVNKLAGNYLNKCASGIFKECEYSQNPDHRLII